METFQSETSGRITIPVDATSCLRTNHLGIQVIVIDAQQWGLRPGVKYDNESFRMLPAMRARSFSPGIDVMFHTINYLDFLRKTTGRLSPIDGDILVSICNFRGLVNAYWTGGKSKGMMLYGNGDNRVMKALVSADVVSHELTHALTETLCPNNLEYVGESGALNECLSDSFAAAYEHYVYAKYNKDDDPSNDILGAADFEVGEDVVLNIEGRQKMRSMSRPEECKQPSIYQHGDFWHDPNNTEIDFGGVHINSGVGNKFFYELCIACGETFSPTALLARSMPSLKKNCTYPEFASVLRKKCMVENAFVVDKALLKVGL
jgi:Zn-dependent metalloprotease